MYGSQTLTEQQLKEFGTPELQGFALAYLKFLHSSPCTSKRKEFPYFKAPDEAHADENDVLYGPDRERAYKDLMWHFRKCQRAKAFDGFFDAAHNQYYESASIPGLVLLKEWIHERTVAPGLYTGSFRDIKPEEYDEVWICLRSLKSMPKNPLGNIKHVQVLSPSTGLWHDYLDWRNAGKWDHKTFRDLYSPRFLKEMLQPQAYGKLQELEMLTRTKAVLVVCYCADESLCHRSLLKKIINQMKASVRTA